MSLHRLASVTVGVPNVAETLAYYTEFGLTPTSNGWLSSTDGGEQLRIVEAPTRRLLELSVGLTISTTSIASTTNWFRRGSSPNDMATR